jgi:hypothetical protein
MRTAARFTVLVTALVIALVPVSAVDAAPTGCGARQLSQPFLPWLDASQYFLLPGGDLESSAGWALSGGARIVAQNEPYRVHGASDKGALELPSGASARSSATCADSDEPTLRFFARNTGSVLSSLAVEATVRTTLLGLTVQTTVPVGIVPGTTQSWAPSLPAPFALSVNQLLGGTTTVDFRFVALGPGGDWYVDDVYVDPFKDRAAS